MEVGSTEALVIKMVTNLESRALSFLVNPTTQAKLQSDSLEYPLPAHIKGFNASPAHFVYWVLLTLQGPSHHHGSVTPQNLLLS